MTGITATLPALHLGPMSLNSVRAALRVAEAGTPLCLIASRRQIDCTALGGGYVNNWTTEGFVHFIRHHNSQTNITLARDHGGPRQGRGDAQATGADAMELALLSLCADIKAGLKILHLDPEKLFQRMGHDTVRDFADRTAELLLACDRYAKAEGITDVTYEIGTDEGVAEMFSPEDWQQFLDQVMECAAAAHANLPVSFAVHMGTRVRELRNVGPVAAQSEPLAPWLDRIHRLQAIAQPYGLTVKMHNADYLPPQTLQWFLDAGLRCFNIAPELGVTETRTLLALLREHGLAALAEEFIEAALASQLWQRWLLPDSTASEMEKATMAGHYVFAVPAMQIWRKSVETALASRGVDLDETLIESVQQVIQSYAEPITQANRGNLQQRAA